jgi:hypothetical protein
MPQALTNLIPAVIFVAIVGSLFAAYYLRIRRGQLRLSAQMDAQLKAMERQTELLARQTDALERIAAALESYGKAEPK